MRSRIKETFRMCGGDFPAGTRVLLGDLCPLRSSNKSNPEVKARRCRRAGDWGCNTDINVICAIRCLKDGGWGVAKTPMFKIRALLHGQAKIASGRGGAFEVEVIKTSAHTPDVLSA